MKKISYLLLLPLLWAACTKNNSRTFTGIVLNQNNNAPIAGAEIRLAFMRNFTPVEYQGTTNAKGEYAIEVSDMGNKPYYFALCQKAKLVQPYVNTISRPLPQSRPDTLKMDDTHYVSMTLKVMPMSANEPYQFFVWELLHELDDRTDIDVPLTTGKHVVLSTLQAGTTINVLDSFAREDVAKVFVKHYMAAGVGEKVLVKKVIPVQALDTTHITIQ